MKTPAGFYFASVGGTPYERGFQHGAELKDAAREHNRRWREVCERETDMPVGDYLKRLYADTDFLPAAKQFAPGLLEEIRGIADGAELPYDEVLARQLSDEEPWYRRYLKFDIDINTLTFREHCSCIGQLWNENQPTIIAQNMDGLPYYQGTQAILHVKNENSDVEAYILTVAGKLSLCGMNNYGVAVCCNTVSQLNFDPKGLAEDFIVRTILEKKSAEEAIAYLKSIPHASGQNYLLGDPDKIVMVECGQNKVVVIEEHLGNGRFIHTNHPLVNDDTEKWDKTMALARAYAPQVYERLLQSQTTYARYDGLCEMAKAHPRFSKETMIAMLSDHSVPICMHGEEYSICATSCVVFTLDREHPVFQATAGPACMHPFETLSFPRR
jgi:hypothetical protein